jgi:chemotaxis signal transduction protein
MKSTTTGRNGASRSSPSSGWSRGGEATGADERAVRWFGHSVCVFWLGGQCFGLESSLVGEVFLVDSYAQVPVAPAAVLGLFNLRGAPVALVDLAQVLELPDVAAEAPEPGGRAILALVLRTGAMTVAAHIRRMEVVLPAGRAVYHPPDADAGEHPVVAGFLELPDRPELTITLLDRDELQARLARLRYRGIEEDEGA